MNKRYIYLAVVALTNMAFATAQQAAKDSTLNREMLIEKEFIPILKDANKISKLPEVEQITVSKAPAIYSIATFTAVPEPEISPLSVGDINNAYPFSNKRGYANLSLGNYRSATFDVGYRILDTKTNILGVYYNLNVSRAKLHYLDEEGKTKQKIADRKSVV